MGYSRSLQTVQRVKNHLDQMVALSTRIEWPSSNPAQLAYRIRDGYKAAARFAVDSERRPVEPYASYARLAAKYVIRTTDGKVIAEPRDVVPLPIEQAGMGRLILSELTSEFELVGAASQHQAPEMFFPDANADSCDLRLLHNWCASNGYFVVVNNAGIMLTKTDPGEIAWHPG